ncbi:hypothetical protein GPN2_11397 [Streptomyces murinus]
MPCDGAGHADWSRPLTGPDPFLKRTLRTATAVRIKRFARFRLASVLPHHTPRDERRQACA